MNKRQNNVTWVINNWNQEPIFIYVRRSTKNKQDLSLERQEDSANETIKDAWYDIEDIKFYSESLSAYNGVKIKGWEVVRRRTEFQRMLNDIDRSPYPVTLLTYEHSRLSRNDYDSQAIVDRLFHEYNKECGTIKKIVFNGWETWDWNMRPSDVKDFLLRAYKESETNKDRTTKSMLRELRKGRYVYTTPIWIERIKHGEDSLHTNNRIGYIIKAWEMKANWKKRKEIDAYLKIYGIKISSSYEDYFQTLIYTGYWYDEENGEYVPQKFQWWKPPISMELYNQVQQTLKKNTGKRMQSKYWEKQKWDVLSELLKWEVDKSKSFSVEFAKWKHPSYKNNAYWKYSKSQNKLIQEYLSQSVPVLKNLIDKVILLYSIRKWAMDNEEFSRRIREVLQELQKMPEDLQWNYFSTELTKTFDETWVWKDIVIKFAQKDKQLAWEFSELLSVYFDEVWRMNRIIDTTERDSIINSLAKKRMEKISERDSVPREYALLKYPFSIAEERMKEIDKEILEIENDISSLWVAHDLEQFVDRLPDILIKIFELSSKVLTNKEINEMRWDILKLVELTTFELSVSTKKELTVKLFDGFKNVINPKSKEWLPK